MVRFGDSVAQAREGAASSTMMLWQSLPEGCDREVLLQSAADMAGVAAAAAFPDVPSEPTLTEAEVVSRTTPDSIPGEQTSMRQPPQAVGGCGLSTKTPQGGLFACFGLLLAAIVRARSPVRLR
jgi:hypothetical protein